MANDLNTKLEEAIKSVVDGLTIAGVTEANTGMDDDDLNAPYVICSVPSSGEEEVHMIGYFRFSGMVKVASSQDDDSLAAHRTRVATVRDELMDTGLAETLSAAVSGLHVPYGGVYFMGLTEETSNRKLISTLELDILSCGSDVSA